MDLFDPLKNPSLKDLLCGIAIEAGQGILKYYRSEDLQSEVKSDGSPLSAADLFAHRLIKSKLQKHFSTTPLLSEEGDIIPYETRKNWQTYWLIDPLDGTKEFLKGTDEFTVNIACIHKGLPVIGVVFAPALKKLYYADPHVGALSIVDGVENSIHTRKASINSPTFVGSRSHGGGEEQAIKALLPEAKFTPAGSSLKFCLLAAGEADFYVRKNPTMEWDTAAGQCVLKSAGGHIYVNKNKDLRYNRSNMQNPAFVAFGDSRYDKIKSILNMM